MPLPLVPIALIGSGVVTAVGGGVNLGRGYHKLRQARHQTDKDTRRYKGALSTTKRAVKETNGRARDYGAQQESSVDAVVHRMADFLRRHEQAVSERASELLEGVVVETQRVDGCTGGRLTPEGLVGHIAVTATATAATYTGIPLAVSTYGSASTGTAITQLGGAAAKNATMAWLGGGSLATGGGGIAVGTVALNFVTIGPSILVAGLVLNSNGEKALTEAAEYRTSVETSLNEQRQLRNRLVAVDQRILELRELLCEMTDRGVAALDELEAHQPFDAHAHAEPFRRALAYAISVRDIASTPLLEPDGDLASETGELLITYRGMRDD